MFLAKTRNQRRIQRCDSGREGRHLQRRAVPTPSLPASPWPLPGSPLLRRHHVVGQVGSGGKAVGGRQALSGQGFQQRGAWDGEEVPSPNRWNLGGAGCSRSGLTGAGKEPEKLRPASGHAVRSAQNPHAWPPLNQEVSLPPGLPSFTWQAVRTGPQGSKGTGKGPPVLCTTHPRLGLHVLACFPA